MADITGARGTSNTDQTIRKIDMGERILLLQPNSTPLTIFTKRTASKATHNTKFQWAEDVLEPKYDTVNGAVASTTTTTATVTNGAYFAEHDLVLNTATNEITRVQAVAGNVVTWVRGAAGSTAVNIGNGNELIIIGSAQPEGDTSKPARSSNPTISLNYTQITRTPVELTESQIHSDLNVSDDDRDYTIKKKGIEHAVDLERTALFGGASIDTSGSQPRRTSKGAITNITTNVTAVGGTLTEASFFAAVRPAFEYPGFTGGEKLMMLSPLVTDVLNAYARGKVLFEQARTSYGVRIVDFQSPHGVLHAVTHPLLKGTKWGGAAVIVDLETKKWRYLANKNGSRDTKLLMNRQAPDADTDKSEYLTEGGMELGQQVKDALLTGITG